MSESWTSRAERASLAALALVVCGAACAGAWGFTVDDALIGVRYAQNLPRWSLNAEGPSTDGVTPLPWPLLIAPLARGDAMDALDRVRVLGLFVHLASMAWLGATIARTSAPRWAKIALTACLGACVPAAEHASSGMETALVTALATVALERPLLAGACAALRPEMIPWAITLAAARAKRFREPLVVAAFPVAIVIARFVAFGHAAPLAVQAKPSDLTHGASYAVAALVVSATPALVLARPRGPGVAIVLAAIAHTLAIVVAGGDWMPYARLFAPIAPGLALAAAHASSSLLAPRALACAALGAWMWITAAPLGRGVARDRRALVLRARPLLAGKKVASVDVGWPSAAARSVVDLAGLTDPEIAALPGGHTSKRVDAAMLLDRDVDAVLLYLDHEPVGAWTAERYARVTEARLARSELFTVRYGDARWLPLSRGSGYVVVFRREAGGSNLGP